MLYNRNKLNKNNDRKILRKVKKNWIVVSLATFAFIGSSYVVSGNVNAKASVNEVSVQNTNSEADDAHSNAASNDSSVSSAESSSSVDGDSKASDSSLASQTGITNSYSSSNQNEAISSSASSSSTSVSSAASNEGISSSSANLDASFLRDGDNSSSSSASANATVASGFSVTDPDYPANMWVDKTQGRYTFSAVQDAQLGGQIVLSTDRNGDGVVYATSIDANGNVVDQETVPKNSSVNLNDQRQTTINNFDYYGVIDSHGEGSIYKIIYDASDKIRVYLNAKSFIVPKLISQTTSYVDQNNKNIVDVDGKEIKPVVQYGLNGQKYTTGEPKLVNGYYTKHFQVSPSNASGIMSPFYYVGQTVKTFFPDSNVTVQYTLLDYDGDMSGQILDGTQVVASDSKIPKGGVSPNTYLKSNIIYNMRNPYIDQTSNIVYHYLPFGSLLPYDRDTGQPLWNGHDEYKQVYENDPNDYSKALNPYVVNIPGYYPVDTNGNRLTPGKDRYPISDPSNPDKDTIIYYVKDPVNVSHEEKTVNRNINYVDSNGNVVATAHNDNVTFDRTISTDTITNETTQGNWEVKNGNSSFPVVSSPVVPGYVLRDDNQKTIPAVTVNPSSSDSNETVTYDKVGSLVPVDTAGNPIDNGSHNTSYPNDPNDAGKVTNPVIPSIPGKTPVDKNGNPLTPGSTYPIDGTKPTEDTKITYVDSNQTAKVSYIDSTTGKTLESVDLSGQPQSTSDYRTTDTIKKYTDQGYKLVSDNYPAGGVKFNSDNKEQDFTVTLEHKVDTVTPDNPGTPGQPINPDNPNGPKWPNGTDKDSLSKTVNQTINYVDGNGKSVHDASHDQVTFGRTATVDEVTGEVTYGNWNNASGTFSPKVSPVVPGYVLRDESQKTIPAVTVNPSSSDSNETVTYDKVGSLVPVDTAGNPIDNGSHNTSYPNDPNDAGKVTNPGIPSIPGKTPVDKNGNPLTPGSTYPIDGTKPTEDTKITYVDSNQTAKVSYIDSTTGKTLESADLSGQPQSTSDYRTTDTIKKYTDQGYKLVSDNYPANGVKFHSDNQEQDFTVTLEHKVDTVTPDNPGTPGQPINPDNPNGPKWPNGTDKDSLSKTVNQTINYVDGNGKSVHDASHDQVTFGRTATVDEVTGEVTYGNWNNASGTFSPKVSPVVPGYVLRDDSQKTIPAVTVNPSSSDSNETVTYDKVGSLVPVDTAGNPIDNGSHNTSYPNDPTDAGKVTNPVIPGIPGKTPVDKNGNPLTPGSTYPIDGTKPTEDTKITYVDSNQTAKVSYIDSKTGKTLESVDLSGQPQSTSDYRTTDTIKKYTDQGYKLVSDNYPAGGVKFNSDNKEQDFTVTLEHKVDTVTPDNQGTPGQPINPDNPNGPKWPNGTDKDSLSKTVNQTINYVDGNGKSVHDASHDQVTFGRTATVDEVTGEVTYGNWNNASGTFSPKVSPVVPGYVLRDDSQKTIPAVTVNPSSSDSNETVTYDKVGSLVPVDTAGNPIDNGSHNTSYPNDPNDAGKVTNPVIPSIPGKTPVDKNGNPLTPGSTYPIDGTKPTEDTKITYVDSNQTAKVSYIDSTTGKTLESVDLSGQPQSTSDYRTTDTIKKYTDQGYKLVSDNYPAGGVKFNSDNKEQDFTVTLEHKVDTVTPDNPGTPGQPINPDNPNGPKWPNGTDKDSLSKTVNQTINYVDGNGKSVHDASHDQVTFGRTATVDEVTGEVTYGNWNNASGTFSPKVSPVVPGYVLRDDSQKTIPAVTVNPSSSDSNETVTYDKVGSLVPVDTAGNPIDNGSHNTSYPNDPNDAGKVTNPVIPSIPGKTPVDKNGNPLTPGSTYPIDGTKPTEDTKITYVDSNQTAKVSYIDSTTGKTLESVDLSGQPQSTSDYRTTDTIKKYTDQGYKLVSDNYPANGVKFHSDNQEQDFTVTLEHKVDTVTPDNPGTPGQPINPDNPNGPKWPNGTDKDSLSKTVNQTINYVDGNGKSVHDASHDQVTFGRTATVDEVTGEVTYGNWNNASGTFSPKVSPVVPGYVLRDDSQKTIPAVTVNPSSSDSNETVTYDKVGSLVPVDTAGNPIDNGSHNTSYPNDPTDAGKVTNPGIPSIPGKTPVDKNGNPLTPGSTYPIDGTKPTEDTKITYVDSNQTAKVSYIDSTTGKTLESVDLSGQPQSTSDYRTTDTIKKYTDQGYKLVSDNYPAGGVKFNSDNKEQDFTVTLEHKVDTVTPDNPGTPGQPINPDNPNGPKWPNGTDKDSLSKTVNQTINYVDGNGKSVHDASHDQVTFGRTATVDEVTGEVTYGNWNNASGTFSPKVSPVVPGYVLRDDSQKTIPAVTVNPSSSDSNETVTYDKVGSLVPVDTAGNPIDNGSHNTSYPNDPTDAGKVTNPGIPSIPGKTPVDKNGNPLTPGSTYPIDGTKPTEDTKITYVDSNQTAKVSYIDSTTGKTLESVDLSGQPQSTSDYRTTDTIKKYTDQGYKLVSDNYPANGVKFHSDNQEQDFTVTLEHKVDTVTPDNPGTPGQPINPDNPNGPKWPNGTDKDSLSKTVTRTINYVDQNGNKIHDSVVQTVTFIREAQVDEVTGQITYGNWTAENHSFGSITSPHINGYVLINSDDSTISVLNVNEDSSDVTINVKYRKLINNPGKPSKDNPHVSKYSKPKLNKHYNNSDNGDKEKLPQTGESNESSAQLMGLILLFISSVLSIFGFRKKQSK